jgi:hypothetical protein
MNPDHVSLVVALTNGDIKITLTNGTIIDLAPEKGVTKEELLKRVIEELSGRSSSLPPHLQDKHSEEIPAKDKGSKRPEIEGHIDIPMKEERRIASNEKNISDNGSLDVNEAIQIAIKRAERQSKEYLARMWTKRPNQAENDLNRAKDKLKQAETRIKILLITLKSTNDPHAHSFSEVDWLDDISILLEELGPIIGIPVKDSGERTASFHNIELPESMKNQIYNSPKYKTRIITMGSKIGKERREVDTLINEERRIIDKTLESGTPHRHVPKQEDKVDPEIEKLRTALRPFAKFGERCAFGWKDSKGHPSLYSDCEDKVTALRPSPELPAISVGQFRKAAIVLASSGIKTK